MSDMRPQGAPNPDPEAKREPTVLTFRAFASFVVAFAVLAVVVHLSLGVLMERFSRDEAREQRARPRLFNNEEGQFPAPRNQVSPRSDLSRLRQRERIALTTYGWVDQKAGVARIPIDRAMTILAERGLPKGRTSPPRGSRTRDQP